MLLRVVGRDVRCPLAFVSACCLVAVPAASQERPPLTPDVQIPVEAAPIPTPSVCDPGRNSLDALAQYPLIVVGKVERSYRFPSPKFHQTHAAVRVISIVRTELTTVQAGDEILAMSFDQGLWFQLVVGDHYLFFLRPEHPEAHARAMPTDLQPRRAGVGGTLYCFGEPDRRNPVAQKIARERREFWNPVPILFRLAPRAEGGPGVDTRAGAFALAQIVYDRCDRGEGAVPAGLAPKSGWVTGMDGVRREVPVVAFDELVRKIQRVTTNQDF